MDVDGDIAPMLPLPPPADLDTPAPTPDTIMEPADVEMQSMHSNQSPGPSPCERPENPAEERRLVMEKEQASEGLQDGRSYCLLDRRWYVEWLQWVGDRSVQSPKHGPMDMKLDGLLPLGRERSWTKDRPGPIDNSGLLSTSDTNKLQPSISEHQHYELVSEEVWNLLVSWYGGGSVIKRPAVKQPSGGVVVELYGITLNLFKSSDSGKSVAMTESKMATVEAFKKRACEEMSLDADKVRIWDYFNKRKYANLEDSITKSLDDCRIYDANDILLEEQGADGSWPPDEQPRTSTSNNHWLSSRNDTSEDVPSLGNPLARGAAGLQNLGNTCFMNSSIQCLSNLPDLRSYFSEDTYKAHVNEGAYKTKGKLADSFAKLLKHMWGDGTVTVAPRNFKWQIGQFAEQFAGYGQQDSMEFIEYVLDGLKEDVNEVRQKPFVELKEAEGRQDNDVAAEAEASYSKRNKSHIDNLFTAFFKSTVTCPEPGCGRVSVKFDPYSSIKLSLVSAVEDRSATFEVSVVLLRSPHVAIQKYSVSAPKFGNAGDLVQAAAEKASLDPQCCFLAEIYNKKIYKSFDKNDSLDTIGSNDTLVLYQQEGGSDNKCQLLVQFRQQQQNYYRAEMLGIPLPALVDRSISGQDLLDAVTAEFNTRLGATFDGKWRLNHTSEKHRVDDCKEVVEPTDELLDLGLRHYVVAELDKEFEAPEVITNMFEENKGYGRSSASSRGAGSVDLVKCFQMYTEVDKLSSDDMWYCSRCKEHREAFKKMELWSLPPVLVLQLKRFTYTTYSRDRLDTAVAFPLEGLDLSPFVIGPKNASGIYDLVSVSKHMGGLGGGHYVAYARSSENGKWYYYNDSSVTEATAQEVANDQVGAYVLFYMRRDRRPASWGPPADP